MGLGVVCMICRTFSYSPKEVFTINIIGLNETNVAAHTILTHSTKLPQFAVSHSYIRTYTYIHRVVAILFRNFLA